MNQNAPLTTPDATPTTDEMDLAGVDPTALEHLDLDTISVGDLAAWLATHGAAHLSAIERIELAERLTRRRFLIGAGALGLGVITGCGAEEEVAMPTAELPGGQYPITVAHDTGTTEVQQKPERIVVVGEYALELALVLEQQPVGIAVLPQIVPDATSGQPVEQIDYYHEYLTSSPLFVGAFAEPSLEAMTAAQPDLVLAYSFPAASKLDTFTQIAPTLEYDFLATGGWQRIMSEVAPVFAAEEIAQAYVSTFEQQVADAQQQLEPFLREGARVNFVTLFGPDLFLFSEVSSVGTLFQRLGMTWALPADAEIPENGFAPGSLEAIATTAADLAIVHNYGAPAETLTQVTDLLEPERPGKVFVLDYSAEPFLGVAGPISERIFLERVVALLTEE